MISTQANQEIRRAAADAGFYLWQVAAEIGVTDGTFSRKLRQELPEAEKESLLRTIGRMKENRDKHTEG